MQLATGLKRVSLVWWGFCGLLVAGVLLYLAFESRQEKSYLAVAPAGAIVLAYGLHTLTCWLVEGFSGKAAGPAISHNVIVSAIVLAGAAGVIASRWPTPQAPRSGPSLPVPAASAPINPAIVTWDKPISQTHKTALTPLEIAAEEVTRAYPYLNTPEGENALKLIIAERDARIARGKRPEVALWEAASAIAPHHMPPANQQRLVPFIGKLDPQ